MSTDGGVLTKEYDVTQAGSPSVVIETTEPAPLDPGQIAPRLHVGVGNGVYIYLNRADQTALAAGSATSMGIIICGLPGINVVACGGVAGALVAAASYVASYGICPNEMEVHFGGFLNPGPNIKCLYRITHANEPERNPWLDCRPDNSGGVLCHRRSSIVLMVAVRRGPGRRCSGFRGGRRRHTPPEQVPGWAFAQVVTPDRAVG